MTDGYSTARPQWFGRSSAAFFGGSHVAGDASSLAKRFSGEAFSAARRAEIGALKMWLNLFFFCHSNNVFLKFSPNNKKVAGWSLTSASMIWSDDV